MLLSFLIKRKERLYQSVRGTRDTCLYSSFSCSVGYAVLSF
jgi:hypothetical protein